MPSQPAPMHTPELKPAHCPFCNGDLIEVKEGSTFRWRLAVCQECGATGPEIRHDTLAPDQTAAGLESDAKAIEAWNQRAPSPGEAALLAALQEAENALANSYDVQEYPGDGKTIQDKALASVRAALSAAQANERE